MAGRALSYYGTHSTLADSFLIFLPRSEEEDISLSLCKHSYYYYVLSPSAQADARRSVHVVEAAQEEDRQRHDE